MRKKVSIMIPCYNEEENLDNDEIYSRGTAVGRIDYAAPEMKKNVKYDFRADIYSLGATIMILMCPKNPLRKIYKYKIRTENMSNMYNKYLRELLIKMTSTNPENRPYAIECGEILNLIQPDWQYHITA